MHCCYCFSVTKSCPTLYKLIDCSPPASSVLHYLLEFAQTSVHWIDDPIQPSRPLLPSFPPALNLSQDQGLFQWVSSLHHVARVLGFSFRVSPSNEYSGLISLRINWFDLTVVQGTLKSLLQHHSSEASILRCSAFFMAQLSYAYMTTGETIAWTIWSFVGKVMSLLFKMLFRFVMVESRGI